MCFLNACNGVDDAAKVMSTYYKIRQTCPSIFSNRDPLSPEIQQCLSNQYYFHLPNTPSGHSVIYHCLSNPTASNYIFDEACKTFFMTIGREFKFKIKFDSWSLNEVKFCTIFRFSFIFTRSIEWFDNSFRHAKRWNETSFEAEN